MVYGRFILPLENQIMEGTKNAATDMQMAAQVKPGHALVAVDPDTGMFVGITPEQLGGGSGGGGGSNIPTSSDETFIII
jgi:hypothetical protein